MQGNIRSIAAQFSCDRDPNRTSLSVTEFGTKDFEEKPRPMKGTLEQNLPGVSSMDQRQRVLACSPALDLDLPTPRETAQPRSREQLGRDEMFTNQSHHANSPSSELGTAVGPTNVRHSPDKTPRTGVAPVETILTRNKGRSTSGTPLGNRTLKPETDTVHNPHIPATHSKKFATAVSATAVLGQGQGSIRRVFEAAPTGAIQMDSQQEALGPRSSTLESSYEESSSTVPKTQKCVYIIRQGKYHAIPHCLETGLRDTLNRTLGLCQSQKSVLKKLASLSPENTVALQAVLRDEGSGGQTRRLVQISIMQKSTFRIGGSREPTVMAVVEDLNPNGEITRKSSHSFSPPSTFFEPPSHGGSRQSLHQQDKAEFYGEKGLPRQRPDHGIQDVSTDIMNLEDYQKELTTYQVWIIEPHSKLKQSVSETLSWAKCTVVEDDHNHDDIVQRLLILDRKTPSADIKRLSLRPDQQSQIARLHDTIVKHEVCSEYQWRVRQLELIRSKSRIFQLLPTITAIVLYLERSPRDHVDLRRLFATQRMHEKDGTHMCLPTTNGFQPFSAPEPAQMYNHCAPNGGPLYYPPYVPYYGYAPTAPPLVPPETPAAPYNPYGPPDFMQPYKSVFSRSVNKPRMSSSSPPFPEQESFADKSSDESELSSLWSGVDAAERCPRKSNSRGRARAVFGSKRGFPSFGRSVPQPPPMQYEPYQTPEGSNLGSKAVPPLLDVQGEARLALDGSRERKTLQSSGPDTRLAERWPIYPSQFDNMPYDPQRNADDEIIKQLLLDWTPQRADIAHGDDRDNKGMGQGSSSCNRAVGGEREQEDCRTSLVTVGNYHGFSEHSGSTDGHSKTSRHKETTGKGSNPEYVGSRVLSTQLNSEDHIEADVCLPRTTDSPAASIFHVRKKTSSALKAARNLESTDEAVSPMVLEKSQWHKAETGSAAEAHRESAEPTKTEEDYNTDVPFEAKTPAVQRRVTMDEVEDEANVKRPTDDRPVEVPDLDEESKKPTRALTFPIVMQKSEAELEWVQRSLQDTGTLSEPTHLATSNIEAFRSRPQKGTRAAHREPMRLHEDDYCGSRNGAAG